MIKKHILFIGVLLVLLIVSFTGCFDSTNNTTSNQKSKFVGTWAVVEPDDEMYNTTWTFFENNSIKVGFDFEGNPTHYYGTYEMENNELKVSSSITTPQNATFNYKFSNGDNRLTLTDNDGEIIFEKTTSDGEDEETPPDTNNDPVASDDATIVDENSENNQINVLTNDQDPDTEDTITITGVTTPSHGTTTYDANYVYYTPTAEYYGTDQFDYTISDGNGGTDTGTVSITITQQTPSEITMNMQEYSDDQDFSTDWTSYYTQYQELVDDGDTLHIRDNISIIKYDSSGDRTNITLCRQVGNTAYCETFRFEGNITNDFQKDDEVIISVTIKRVIFTDDGFDYDMEIFEEQWESAEYFNTRVDDFTGYYKGFKPMNPNVIEKI